MFTEIHPPPGEPVSLADAKTFLRVGHDGEDALIADLLASAREQVERRAATLMIAREVRLDLPSCATRLRLPIGPVQELVGVEAEGEAVVGATLQPTPHSTWLVLPRAVDGFISVTVRAGYGTAEEVPAPLRQAVLLLVADAFEHREREAGFARTALRVDALLGPWRGPRL